MALRRGERLGLGLAWHHFFSMSHGESGPCLEAWTASAGLAMATERIRIGVFVSGVTHRHPAVLAKQAATVDRISGGRLILGLGAAWNERARRLRHPVSTAPRARRQGWRDARNPSAAGVERRDDLHWCVLPA